MMLFMVLGCSSAVVVEVDIAVTFSHASCCDCAMSWKMIVLFNMYSDPVSAATERADVRCPTQARVHNFTGCTTP